jgi:XTP/dITP diphosphohydrolase
MELLVATTNKKKLAELKELLSDMDIRLLSLADFPKRPRVTENGKTFHENAIKKAVTNAKYFKRFTLAEDSGLCVAALSGMPGVFSARFAGRSKNDDANNRKVLRLLAGVPVTKRAAHYACVVALADEHGVVGLAEGTCQGRIGLEPQGTSGFGYDPIFVIPRRGKTFAELGEKIKHTMSHRYRALKKVKPLIREYLEAKEVR